MKLRYYMRGLGIGIVVTAILMSVTINGKTEKLTDAEIIERAEALGMEQKYNSTVLADTVSDNAAEKDESDVSDQKLNEPDTSEQEVNEPDASEQEKEIESEAVQPQEIETDVAEETEEEEKPSEPETGKTVQITVQGGDGSQTVARKLAEAGVIDDVLAYDKFLCRNGYDKRICTGTHTIPVGATDEEIAKIITSRP